MTNKFVFDTNVLISAFLNPKSTSFLADKLAIEKGEIVYSNATFSEFKEVLFRPKFDKYLTKSTRIRNLRIIRELMVPITPTETINDCRDPKDNKFLELAVAANAHCLITGDDDLLILNPFRSIPIINATDFLAQF